MAFSEHKNNRSTWWFHVYLSHVSCPRDSNTIFDLILPVSMRQITCIRAVRSLSILVSLLFCVHPQIYLLIHLNFMNENCWCVRWNRLFTKRHHCTKALLKKWGVVVEKMVNYSYCFCTIFGSNRQMCIFVDRENWNFRKIMFYV